jgi:hypothetical protein
MVVAAILSGPLAAQTADAPSPIARYVDPLARAREAPPVVIDVTAAPEAKAWAEQARALVRDWFPPVCQLLATEKFTPPKEITLVFKPDISAPAYTAGGEITVNATWIKQHPEDFGMIIHEMTHVIQAYPNGGDKPGWLVEGIADYIRWWRYEPEAPRTRINPEKASYRDSYRTTAAFLAWACYKYDRSLVRKLDEALRERKYSPEIFDKATGESLDALWGEYIAGVRQAAR